MAGSASALVVDKVPAIWLRKAGDWVEVLIETPSGWKLVIREHQDGPFSHIVEPSRIEQLLGL